MDEDKVRRLLNELHQEMATADEVDAETLAQVQKLDREIHDVIGSDKRDDSPILDDAVALEARFAATHPMAERIIRELIYNLGRIGI